MQQSHKVPQTKNRFWVSKEKKDNDIVRKLTYGKVSTNNFQLPSHKKSQKQLLANHKMQALKKEIFQKMIKINLEEAD